MLRAVFLLALVGRTFAQSTQGSLTGHIEDSVDGHAVAGAAVDHFIAETTKRKPHQWAAIALGRSASQIHMAHALLIHDADETYDAGLNDEDLTIEVQARHRADAAIIRAARGRPFAQPEGVGDEP